MTPNQASGVNDGSGISVPPNGADDAPDESKGAASNSAPAPLAIPFIPTREAELMNSETLRKAAALMRERAEAVIRWAENHPEESGGPGAWFTPVFMANAFATHAPGDSSDPVLREGWTLDGDHYASWNPAVAIAVADLLDGLAGGIEAHEFVDQPYPERAGVVQWPLAIARTYLGATDA